MRAIECCTMLLMVSLLFSEGHGQIQSYGENVDFLDTTGAFAQQFRSDSLYLGRVFLLDTTRPFLVSFKGSSSPATGYLYLMKPDGDTIRLFSNHPGRHGTAHDSLVDLTLQSRRVYRHMDTVVFMYREVFDSLGVPVIAQRHYSGPNRAPVDRNADGSLKWLSTDRFYANTWSTSKPAFGLNDFQIGRRSFAMGWMRQQFDDGRVGYLTDSVEFAVNAGSNGSFSDIRFQTTGMFLMKSCGWDTFAVTLTATDSVVAVGDSIVFNLAGIEGDSLCRVVDVPADTLKKYATWQLVKNNPHSTNPGLTHGVSQTSTNVFKAISADETFVVIVSCTKDGQTIILRHNIRILPSTGAYRVNHPNTTGRPDGTGAVVQNKQYTLSGQTSLSSRFTGILIGGVYSPAGKRIKTVHLR